MRKLWVVLAGVVVLACPLTVKADCDQKEAKNLIKKVVNGGVASREDQTVTIVYNWKANWHSMSKEKQYSMTQGLFAGVSLDGSVMSISVKRNQEYWKKEMSAANALKARATDKRIQPLIKEIERISKKAK